MLKKVDNLILKCSDVKPKKLLILMRLRVDLAVDSAERHSKVAIYFMEAYSECPDRSESNIN